ncbi:ubiquitin-conjugating enzyme 36 [Striga asiatica]|uniref:Ubiquitin-conjugating enzyme 36 n=1 Tax=Striga asiatica TaxID=4170 RepID=A0A5A7R2U4_STRAF|nr:ubiquitin-conjugating enzyme 36 [Striga asiatica]
MHAVVYLTILIVSVILWISIRPPKLIYTFSEKALTRSKVSILPNFYNRINTSSKYSPRGAPPFTLFSPQLPSDDVVLSLLQLLLLPNDDARLDIGVARNFSSISAGAGGGAAAFSPASRSPSPSPLSSLFSKWPESFQ